MIPKLNHLSQYSELTSPLLSYLTSTGIHKYTKVFITVPHRQTHVQIDRQTPVTHNLPVSSSHGFTSSIILDFAITTFSMGVQQLTGTRSNQSYNHST